MFFHPRNITKAPLTTVVGLLLILAATASVLTGKTTWAEAVVVYPIALGLLTSRDPKQKDDASK